MWEAAGLGAVDGAKPSRTFREIFGDKFWSKRKAMAEGSEHDYYELCVFDTRLGVKDENGKTLTTKKFYILSLTSAALGLIATVSGLALTFGGFVPLDIALPILLSGSIVSFLGLASLISHSTVHTGSGENEGCNTGFAIILVLITTLISLGIGYGGFGKGAMPSLGVYGSVESGFIAAAFSAIIPMLILGISSVLDIITNSLEQEKASSIALKVGLPLLLGTFAGVLASVALGEVLTATAIDLVLSFATQVVLCPAITMAVVIISSFFLSAINDSIKESKGILKPQMTLLGAIDLY